MNHPAELRSLVNTAHLREFKVQISWENIYLSFYKSMLKRFTLFSDIQRLLLSLGPYVLLPVSYTHLDVYKRQVPTTIK